MVKAKTFDMAVWWPLIRQYPGQYSLIICCVILSIFPALILIRLVAYAIKQLQTEIKPISWIELVGEHASRWVGPVVRGTRFSEGISPEFQIQWFAAILVTFGFLAALFRFVQEYLLEDMGEKIARDLRNRAMQRFVSLPFAEASQKDAGLVASLVGDDTREIRQTFTRLWGSIVADSLKAIVFTAWLALVDTQLFVLFVAVLLPAGIVIRMTGRALKRLSRQGLESQTELLGSLLEKMRGWQTIQVHAADRFEINRFNKTNNTLYHVWRRATRAKALGTPLVEWLGIIAAACIIVIALRRIAEDALTSGILIFFLGIVAQLSDSIQSLVTQLNGSKKGTEALRRLLGFVGHIEPVSKIQQPHTFGSDDKQTTINELKLNSVVVGHPKETRPLTSEFSLSLAKGDFCVIIGSSGAGKSTLLRTILGLELPFSGHTKFNGAIPKQEDFLVLSKDIAFVPQDPFVFAGTVLENVVYPEVIPSPSKDDLAKVEQCLALANLPKQSLSDVNGLSGGERQRLMFARAFYRDASFWVIDEGTSALDAKNEKEILERIKSQNDHRIVVFVAHRSSVKEYATQILDLNLLKPKESP